MDKSVKKLQSIQLQSTSRIRLIVWHLRRMIRDLLGGKDILHTTGEQTAGRTKVREVYLKADQFITRHLPILQVETPRTVALKRIREVLERDLGYEFYDVDEKKPWGAYYRIIDEQAERFIAEFFPTLSINEARFGREDVELSPKILVAYPGQRLSWQFHDRRAERWRFLTAGGYHRSHSDDPGERHNAMPGEIVQFDTGERHRLCGADSGYTLVAEIWQHTDPTKVSDESDIVRLSDDYNR